MGAGPNLSPIPTPLPQPAAPPQLSPAAVDTAKQTFQTPPDPPQYFGGKAGAVADIANKVLTGWMSGKMLGEQKAAQKAASTIGTMKDAVDTAGQAYRAAVEGGDPKKIEAAGKVLQQQWGEYNDAREKYVIPPDMGKQGVGGKVKSGVKKALAPQGPELYLQAAITASKQIDPRDLYGPSKREQQESKLTDLQLGSAERATAREKRDDEARTKYEGVLQKPDKDLTPEDKKFRDTYEQLYLGRTKEQLFQDQILDKVTGNQALNEFERTKAEQMGIVKPAVTNTQVRTVMGPGGKPQTQLIAIGPDGKMVGTPQTLPGTDYVPPNQADLAGKVINNEVSAYARLLGKAHPEWDEQTRYSMALGIIAKGTGMDWAMKNQQQDVMNRALLKMIQAHTKTYKDSDGNPVREYDDEGKALMSHFVSSSDDGRYAWNASLGDKSDPSWFAKLWGEQPTYGGYSQEQLSQYDKQARAELRAILKEQNKGLSDVQIDQMMPAAGFGQKQAGGQQAGAQGIQAAPQPPKQGAPENAPQGVPPGMGQQVYSVLTPSGRVQRPMTKEQAEALKAQGVDVSLIGGSTP